MSIEAVFLLSIVAGLVGSMTGMGGGVVLIPTLTFFGMDIKQAIALSILSMLVIANTAAARYVSRHLPNFRIGGFLELFAIIGAIAGSILTVIINQRLLFFLCGVIFFLFSWILWKQRNEEWKPPTHQDVFSKQLGFEGSYYDYAEGHTIAYRGRRALVAAPLMTGAAFVSGLLGIGGSGFTVLINNLVIGLPPKVSLTTSHLIISIMALASADVYLETGLIPIKLIMPMILGIALGAYVGSGFLIHLTNRITRQVFLCVLLVLGIEMLTRGL